jgi:hypothetical protein
MTAATTQPSTLPNLDKPIRHSLIMHDPTVAAAFRNAVKAR